MNKFLLSLLVMAGAGVIALPVLAAEPIQHDVEHYVLIHQYKDQWEKEDKEIDKKLAELREKNGGKKPNIVYILIDDMGFCEFGMPELNKIRGGHDV
jgi:hypothetical protein